jgi:hypothetical protein
MDAGRLDQVHIDVAGELLEISWDERNELLERIRIVVDDETIVEKFEAVGTRRPVELDSGERGRLRMALELWDAVALGDLPDGIAGLLAVLAKADPGGL